MARTNNLTNFLTDVAGAIKTKKGSETNIPAANFDTEILALPSQGTYQEKSVTISANGTQTITPDTGYDAIEEIEITTQVPQKQLQTKSYEFTTNANIELEPDIGYDGFSSVGLAINVPSGGIDTSDATATADDILNPETAYVKGQKITGNMVASYVPLESQLATYNILTIGNSCCLTRDSKALIVWNGSNIYTFVFNESLGVYEGKNTYTESQLGITNSGGQDYGTRLIDCSAYEPNSYICYVAFFRYKNNMRVITFNADTGVLLYTGGGEYVAARGWYGSGDRTFPMAYLEPVYSIAFSELNPNILYFSYNNGFSARYTSWTSVTKLTWTHGGNFDTTQHAFIGTTTEDKYLIKDNTISLLDSTGQSASGSLNLGTNPAINPSYTLLVADGKLYSITETGTSIVKGSEISTNVSLFNTKGMWLSNTVFCQLNSNTIYVYELEDVTDVKVTTFENMNNFNKIRNSDLFCVSSVSSANSKYVKALEGEQDRFASLYAPKYRSTLYNTDDSDGVSGDVLLGKVIYNVNGKVTGTMPNNGVLNYTPSDSSQSIPAGYTSGGTISAVNITTLTEYQTCLALTNIILE